ncbi:MAG: exosortase [Motiliproteus sp.]
MKSLAMLRNSERQSFSIIGLVVALAIPVILFLVNWAIVQDLWLYSFDDGTYSHAYLVPLVFLYLIYEAGVRQKLVFADRLSVICLLGFVLVSVLYLATYTAQIALLYRALFPLSILLAMFVVFRPSIAVAMPIVVTWFIFPIWGVLTSPLQELSVKATNLMMSFSSIPTYVEGNFVHIPAGVFEIAGGCSGLRYFIVSLLISILFVYLNISRLRQATIFLVVALAGALVVNWIRIVILICVGHFTEMQSSMMDDHNVLGWYLYVPYMIALMSFGRWLSDPGAGPNDEKVYPSEMPGRFRMQNLMVVIVLALMFSSASVKIIAESQAGLFGATTTTLSSEFRKSGGDWSEIDSLDLTPAIATYSKISSYSHPYADSELLYRRYYFSGASEALKATYYLHQPLPQADWDELNTEYSTQAIYVTAKGPFGKKAIVAYWYQYDDFHTGSRNQVRLERLKGAINFKRETYYHWLWIPCQLLCEDERLVLEEQVSKIQNNPLIRNR